MDIVHVPVMLPEILDMMAPKDNGIYVDATLGLGGHAEGMLKLAPECTLIGLDRDGDAIEMSRERLKGYSNVHLERDSFSNMKEVVNGLGYEKVTGILIDAGVSTMHLKAESRGFSFLRDEPLDMRMDCRQSLTAERVVNSYTEKDLADIIFQYGEERASRRIARGIVYARRRKPISSCKELGEIIARSLGGRGRIHPATRTFQAIRIEVNKELEELSKAVDAGAELLAENGRYFVVSYHSLEDRIIKNAFRKLAKEGIFNIITKKPLVPGRDEQRSNPSSRSAKLRVAEKI